VIAFRYTVMRLMIFVGFLAVLLLLDVALPWAVVGAALLSMVASYFLLAPDREQMASSLERRVEARMARRRQQLEDERVAEDGE
jgi:ABC-type bacteriocin/lantibiotic exporter with double-glycine peptidase domain